MPVAFAGHQISAQLGRDLGRQLASAGVDELATLHDVG